MIVLNMVEILMDDESTRNVLCSLLSKELRRAGKFNRILNPLPTVLLFFVLCFLKVVFSFPILYFLPESLLLPSDNRIVP